MSLGLCFLSLLVITYSYQAALPISQGPCSKQGVCVDLIEPWLLTNSLRKTPFLLHCHAGSGRLALQVSPLCEASSLEA